MRSEYAPERKPVAVEISLIDGRVLKGKLWAVANKSLADTLNGALPFLEFTPYGAEQPQFLSRAHILTLSPIDIPKAARFTNVAGREIPMIRIISLASRRVARGMTCAKLMSNSRKPTILTASRA